MKSYEDHLKSVRNFNEDIPLHYKPVMRSSAIFPLVVGKGKIDSIYTFMGYWLRKRNITVVTALLTVRDSNGEKILVNSKEIRSSKSYVFRGSDFVNQIENHDVFFGSVEIEIFSAVDMVYPYPAITFAFEGVRGLTFVHTCGRIYNDFDDLAQNTELQVPETGFDVLVDKSFEPFFAFINGPRPMESEEYSIEIIGQKGNSRTFHRTLPKIPQYGLGWINVFDSLDEREEFIGDGKVTVKISHNFKGFFPRFVAGNAYRDYTDISLTHSYYDNSADTRVSAVYKNPKPLDFLDGVLAIPYDSRFDEIELAIYPCLALSPCTLSFALHNAEGDLLNASEHSVEISNGENVASYIKLLQLFSHIEKTPDLGMIRVSVDGDGVVPTRIKFGLNLAKAKEKISLSSNICFAVDIPNEKITGKPGTFRWCTLFNPQYQRIYLHNTSFVRKGSGSSQVQVEVCRELDDEKKTFELSIPQDGTVEVISGRVQELADFLKDELGWVSFQCSNPFVTGYYVTDYKNGVVGADHIY